MASNLPKVFPRFRFPPLPSIKDILQLYRLRALKELSQNFLMDPRLCSKIVKSAGNVYDNYVVEVGPGPGNITRAILEAGAREVAVIEKDPRFLPSLELLADASKGKLKIIQGDIMDHPISNIFPSTISRDWQDEIPPLHIIGNLPFNVSTALITRWLRYCSIRSGPFHYGRTKMTLTFQKEVAERIAAPIMSKERNRLSIICQYLCHVQYKATITGSSFLPPPDVDVGVVTLTPHSEPLIDLPFELVNRVLRCVFHFRQKFCKRGAALLFPGDKYDLAGEMLEMAKIHPEDRPFELSVEDFGRICHAYNDICKRFPELANYSYITKKLN